MSKLSYNGLWQFGGFYCQMHITDLEFATWNWHIVSWVDVSLGPILHWMLMDFLLQYCRGCLSDDPVHQYCTGRREQYCSLKVAKCASKVEANTWWNTVAQALLVAAYFSKGYLSIKGLAQSLMQTILVTNIQKIFPLDPFHLNAFFSSSFSFYCLYNEEKHWYISCVHLLA